MELLVGLFFVYILLLIPVFAMASSRGRSVFGWFLLSLILSPIFAIILLSIVGDSDSKRYAEMKKMTSELGASNADIITIEEIKTGKKRKMSRYEWIEMKKKYNTKGYRIVKDDSSRLQEKEDHSKYYPT